MPAITSFRDLLVWQKSMDLAVRCHEIADGFHETNRPYSGTSFGNRRCRCPRMSPKDFRGIRQRSTFGLVSSLERGR